MYQSPSVWWLWHPRPGEPHRLCVCDFIAYSSQLHSFACYVTRRRDPCSLQIPCLYNTTAVKFHVHVDVDVEIQIILYV